VSESQIRPFHFTVGRPFPFGNHHAVDIQFGSSSYEEGAEPQEEASVGTRRQQCFGPGSVGGFGCQTGQRSSQAEPKRQAQETS